MSIKLRSMNFQNWLLDLPEESRNRLRAINMSAGSAEHIILALAFGIYDRHIRKVNQMITSLLVARLRAERAGKVLMVNRINSFMEEMHAAIDQTTGGSVPTSIRAGGSPCNRPVQAKLAGKLT
jgi:hypothetical protein